MTTDLPSGYPDVTKGSHVAVTAKGADIRVGTGELD